MAAGDRIFMAKESTSQEILSNTKKIIEDAKAKPKRYGMRINLLDSNPATRVKYLYDAVGMTPAGMNFAGGGFDYGDWGDIWFVKKNRPVMVRTDGTVDYELNHENHALKLNGGASDITKTSYGGNAMSEIPLIWVKRWTQNNYHFVVFCEEQYDDTYKAYAHTDADGNVLPVTYFPMYEGSVVNNRMRSLSGLTPTASMTDEKAWKPSRHGKVCINEGTSRKVRMIEKPRYNYEQVIHHIVVSACYDIFMKGMYEFSCGSVPNRGAHYGKKYIERWIQRDKKNCKYVLKMDIRHFFESVDHDVLKVWLKKKIRDERMLYILALIIDGSEVGLPLGFYTSQWLSNFMLQPLDHFIKEQLKAVHYIRYMDDMVVFGKNKKELHRMQQEIERFLREKFNLQMKGNWQVFRFDYTEKKTGKRKGRPLDFMGFQFYHDKTILRESIMLSCTRKVNRVAKKEKITWYDATAILSYMGYLSNTDTYDMYLQRVKPYVNVKKLKKIVSKHSKRKEREKHERMERSVRNGGRTAGGVRHNSVTDNGISETQYQESNERGCRRKENHRMAARGA